MEDAQITTSMITLAHNLKLRTVAEGVETRDQLRMLRDLGCDEVQGYLLGKPMPADAFTERLTQPGIGREA
jgi:EAL domain-containing protein (putative c-di-GMP-specific phosphodiesterase class I)